MDRCRKRRSTLKSAPSGSAVSPAVTTALISQVPVPAPVVAAPVVPAPAAPAPVTTAPPVAAPAVASAVPSTDTTTRIVPQAPVAVPAITSESDDQQAGGLFSAQDAQRLQAAAARIQVPVPAYSVAAAGSVRAGEFQKVHRRLGKQSRVCQWAGTADRFDHHRCRRDRTGQWSLCLWSAHAEITPEIFPASSVVFSGQIERDTLKFTLRVGVFGQARGGRQI